MTTLSQSSSNDLYLDSSGQLSLASGTEAYGFIIADAIRTLRGELQLDTENGVPWMSTLLASRNRTEIWKFHVEKRIKEFDFVDDVLSFSATYDQSSHTVNFKIRILTTDGTTETITESVFG